MIKYILLIITFSVIGLTSAQANISFGIAATVNKDAISESDVQDRINLLMASTGMSNTQENREKISNEALNVLIEEQLKIQEAEKNNLEVTKDEIDEAFAEMAARNKLSPPEFASVMAGSGVTANTLRQQIKAELAWSKVVGGVLRPQVDVSDNDIAAKLERLKDNIGKTEYKVSEIFLPVNSPVEDSKAKEIGLGLIQEVKNGRAPFGVVASQFSKSSSASQGGSIGWIQEGDLPKELDIVVKSLNKGQISPPIKSLSGYYILTLTDQRTISQETLPSNDDILNSIGLQRLDKLQKKYLSDIQSASFIDRRR
jgi:peptidyl-prolyl cis-trans isomerase SurA